MVCRFSTALPDADETNEPQSCVGTRRTDPVLMLDVPVASSVVTPDAAASRCRGR